MTIFLPKPQLPAGMTILQAMSMGLLPAEVQVLNADKVGCTLAQLLASGRLNHSALCSTLTFPAGNAVYGGN